MNKILLAIALSLGLAGCSTMRQPVPVERPALEITAPAPLVLNDVHWYVVTDANYEATMKELDSKGLPRVLYALDNDGYAKNEDNQEMIQGRIILLGVYFKQVLEYYKPVETPK